jgi:hypothetical protein
MKGLALTKLLGQRGRHDSIKVIDEWVSIPAYDLASAATVTGGKGHKKRIEGISGIIINYYIFILKF